MLIIINVEGDENNLNGSNNVTVSKIGVGILNEYQRYFDESCVGWTKDPEYNKQFLLQVQHDCNEKLRAQGYLFLNDVYDMLGIPKTKVGQVVGWIYDQDNPIGDNFVDFGLDNNRDFINGYGNVALLDFNVDGEILSRMY